MTKMSIKRVMLIGLIMAVGSAVTFCAHWMIREQRQWKLTDAAGRGDLTTVKQCVEAGANIDAVPTSELGTVEGAHALTAAALFGHEEVVRYLLDHGANPNLHGMSNPLIAACWKNHYAIGKLLLEHGADPNARGEGNPLYAAEGKPELLALLKSYGAR